MYFPDIIAYFSLFRLKHPILYVSIPVMAVLICGACTNLPFLSEFGRTAEFVISGQPDVPIQRAQIDKLPYASIRAKIGRSGRVIMVLGRYDGPDLHWISADLVALVTRGGRLVKSAGLPENIKNTQFIDDDPVESGLNRLTESVLLRRTIDMEFENNYGMVVVSRIEPAGQESITILDRNYSTSVYREHNIVEALNWEFVNYFWIDPATGFVWKSRQHLTPSLPPVEIEILKPAS
jgi:hypothetical protein